MRRKTKWVERQPQEGEIVKVRFADFTALGSKIGVLHPSSTGMFKVKFDDCVRYFDTFTTFHVLEKI